MVIDCRCDGEYIERETSSTTTNLMTTEIDYRKIAAFDLQDYVDNLTEEEQVAQFRSIGQCVQRLEADAMWLENHTTYPYSDECCG